MSDLHLETHPAYNFKFKQTAPYLALLGDIGHVADDGLLTFLEKQIKRYWAVFFVLGNHEPSGLTFDATKARLRAFQERIEKLRSQSTIGRFIFLDQTRYDISDSLTILGCTLFSHIPPEQEAAVASRLTDFKHITHWHVHNHNAAHRSDLNWLNAQVAEIAEKEPHRRVVVFTHHSPCTDDRAVEPRHRRSEVSSGFVTDLRNELCWTSPVVRTWAFGHTHFNFVFTDDRGLTVISNQKGYSMIPEDTFDADRVYSVGD
ncbi:hypothetical protein PRK78_006384 [Emydomyces testavorans]|uniref:Calcineurin-like phosphoesterase domain-containing protein n=1 Tax=Emydomyces testavorans TaxID=2070801 RepID=A0AAF0ILM2_9EURO|nr:hypothetical protein PRK78_006384 [Emydomyces testavorans]